MPSRRPPPSKPPRRAAQSQAMPAVRMAAEAIRSELAATPAAGTDVRPGQLVRKEAMRILRDAEREEQNARQKLIWRAIRELFEQMLGRER